MASYPGMRLTSIWFAAMAAAACARDARPTPSRPASPQVTRALLEGSHAGIEVPAPMRLVTVYGEDAWQLPGRAEFGSAGPGRHIAALVSDRISDRIYVVDAATGQPTGSVLVGSQRRLTAVAVDPTGTRVAGLVDDGNALYWPALDARPVLLVPQAADPSSVPEIHVDDVTVGGQREPYVRGRASGGEDAWAIQRASHRLSFSSNGARLLAGMHVYDLATERDLTPLLPDEIVLDASHDAMTVARALVKVIHREPGWCGFVSPERQIRALSIQQRTIAAWSAAVPVAPLRQLLPFPDETAYPHPPTPAHDALESRAITSIDIADDHRVAFVQDGAGWLVDRGRATQLQVEGNRVRVTRFVEVALAPTRVFAVTQEDRDSSRPSVIYAFDPGGIALSRVVGRAAHVSRVGRVLLWLGAARYATADLARAERDQDVALATVATVNNDGGRVAPGERLVWLRLEGAPAIMARDPGASSPRVLLEEPHSWHWTVSDDGTTLAVLGPTLHVVDIATGRERWRVPFDPDAEAWESANWALATSAHLVATSAGAGHVRLWRDGVASEIDLTGRHDTATSLAISRDERTLAIGTGRGRILVITL